MRVRITKDGVKYIAEQDKRGRADEAEVVIYKGMTEMIRFNAPKLTEDELTEMVMPILEDIEK